MQKISYEHTAGDSRLLYGIGGPLLLAVLLIVGFFLIGEMWLLPLMMVAVFEPTLREAAEEFLDKKRIAVAGVSRDPKQPANLIYRRLRDTGHDVFAVIPGGCPNMFGATSDPGHVCLRAMLRAMRKLPRRVGEPVAS